MYLKNRCPSNALENKTPYEMWYGRLPSLNHLGFLVPLAMLWYQRNKEASWEHEVGSAFSWGIPILPRLYCLNDEVKKKSIV